MADKDVLMWGAPWCAACHEKRPLVEQACLDHGVPFTYYDCDDPANARLAQQYGFRSIPAVAVTVRDHFHVAYRAVGGLINRASLDTFLAPPAPPAPPLSDSGPAAP